MDTFLGGCAERTANALTPRSATTRIATMTIHIRFFLPPAAGAGGATGSAKVSSSVGTGHSSRPVPIRKNGGSLFNGFPRVGKIIESRLNDAAFRQSLDHGLHARAGEVSFVNEELPNFLRAEPARHDLLGFGYRGRQEELSNGLEVRRRTVKRAPFMQALQGGLRTDPLHAFIEIRADENRDVDQLFAGETEMPKVLLQVEDLRCDHSGASQARKA